MHAPRRGGGAGEIDVALGTLDSPIGSFGSGHARGLACIASTGGPALARRFASVRSHGAAASRLTDEARRQLGSTSTAGATVRAAPDRRLMTPFAREVLGATARRPGCPPTVRSPSGSTARAARGRRRARLQPIPIVAAAMGGRLGRPDRLRRASGQRRSSRPEGDPTLPDVTGRTTPSRPWCACPW